MERRGRWQKRAGESEEKPGDDRPAVREGAPLRQNMEVAMWFLRYTA